MWLCGFLSAYCYSKNWMFAVTQVKQKLKTQSQPRAYSTLFILYLAKEYNVEKKQELFRFGARGLGGQRNRKLFPETRVRP